MNKKLLLSIAILFLGVVISIVLADHTDSHIVLEADNEPIRMEYKDETPQLIIEDKNVANFSLIVKRDGSTLNPTWTSIEDNGDNLTVKGTGDTYDVEFWFVEKSDRIKYGAKYDDSETVNVSVKFEWEQNNNFDFITQGNQVKITGFRDPYYFDYTDMLGEDAEISVVEDGAWGNYTNVNSIEIDPDVEVGDGSFKGETFLNVSRDLEPQDYAAWLLTTNQSANIHNSPMDTNWTVDPGESITITIFNDSTQDVIAPNGDSGDHFRIHAFYDNTTDKLATVFNSTTAPPDGINISITGTEGIIDKFNVQIPYGNKNISSQDGFPRDIAWKKDGTKLYEAGSSQDDIYEYELSDPYNISSATHNGKIFEIQEDDPYSLSWKDDGTKFYIAGPSNDKIYQYNVSDPWNISSTSYNNVNMSVDDFNPTGIAWKKDGTKLYVVTNGNDLIAQYNVSDPWNLSSAKSDNVNISTQDSNPNEITWNNNGTKLYEADDSNDPGDIYEYHVSDPWNLSSAIVLQKRKAQSDFPQGLAWNDVGSKLYEAAGFDEKIYQYSLDDSNRSGVVRLAIDARSESTLDNWEADSDNGTTTGGTTYDTEHAQGFLRSGVNVTELNTYEGSDCNGQKHKFMRNISVCVQFKMNSEAYQENGYEQGIFSIEGSQGEVASKTFNLTRKDKIYNLTWKMKRDAAVNDYIAKLFVSGQANSFSGNYDDQFSSQNENLTLNDGGTHTLWDNETHRYDYINITNGTTVHVKDWNGTHAGELTLQADKDIFIGENSTIDANGSGFRGGDGGSDAQDGEDGEDRNGGPAIDRLNREGAGAGGGSGEQGAGGGGAGYGGSGGAGDDGIGSIGGAGGSAYGAEKDHTVNKGSGGGGGGGDPFIGNGETQGDGGDGGGVIVLEADGKLEIRGKVTANGEDGTNGCTLSGGSNECGDGGAGAAGTILLNSSELIVSSESTITAIGGNGASPGINSGAGGGAGGGRVKLFTAKLTLDINPLVSAGSGGEGAEDGEKGTFHNGAGEKWSEFTTTTLSRDTDDQTNFDINNVTDPDSGNSKLTTIWVEDELILDSDWTPQSNSSTKFAGYLNRGEWINWSFVIKDEYGRTFENDVNMTINDTSADIQRNLGVYSLDANGRISDETHVGADWTDTHDTNGNFSEHRNYTFIAQHPIEGQAYSEATTGVNNSQGAKFDISDFYLLNIRCQDSSTLDPAYSNETFPEPNELGQITELITTDPHLGNQDSYCWNEVRNARNETLSGLDTTIRVWNPDGELNDTSPLLTTQDDGYTSSNLEFIAHKPIGDWILGGNVTHNGNTGEENDTIKVNPSAEGDPVKGEITEGELIKNENITAHFHLTYLNGSGITGQTPDARITFPDGTTQSSTMTELSGGVYEHEFNATQSGQYEIRLNNTHDGVNYFYYKTINVKDIRFSQSDRDLLNEMNNKLDQVLGNQTSINDTVKNEHSTTRTELNNSEDRIKKNTTGEIDNLNTSLENDIPNWVWTHPDRQLTKLLQSIIKRG